MNRGSLLSAVLLGILALSGEALSSRAATQTVLVPTNAVWRFSDTGSDLGTGWKERDYDDRNWASGPAELGYGDAGDGRPEATLVSYGPDPNNKSTTTYFRHWFSANNVELASNLTARLLRDDGAVVYLNGQEVFRSNMPEGPVDYLTFAQSGVGGVDEATFFSYAIAPTALANGSNLLAVEIHQDRPASSDISFALELLAEGISAPPPSLTRGPYLQMGTPSSVIVKWRTDRPAESLVLFGVASDRLHFFEGDLDETTEHEVKLDGLSPQSLYYYAIESLEGERLAGGPEYFFWTAATNAKPTRIWVIGDSGTAGFPFPVGNAPAVRDAYERFAGDRYTDLWLMLGDNAYGSGTDAEYQVAVFDMYTKLLRQTILWSTIGNHETYSAPQGAHIPYLDIFSLPEHAEAGGISSGTERYYSFDYGNIHFVCLDSMTSDRGAGGPMLNWLQSDLVANTKDWLIAFWHHPPYSKGSHNSDDTAFDFELVDMRQNALPILEAYGVDLVLSGHSHIYERSFLINGHYGFSTSLLPIMIKDEGSGRMDDTGAYRKETATPGVVEGTVYVVAGSSGQATFRVGHHPAMFMDELQMGSLVLDIDGNRLDARFLRETGAIDDYFTIIKGGTAEPLHFTTFRLENGIEIARWKSIPGQSYQIQRTANLGSVNWTPVSPPIVATGATTTWTNSMTTGAKAFYRVQILSGMEH